MQNVQAQICLFVSLCDTTGDGLPQPGGSCHTLVPGVQAPPVPPQVQRVNGVPHEVT